MKYKLIDVYYDLKMMLPAYTYQDSCRIHRLLSRTANLLWNRYQYDIDLSKSFK